MVHSPKLRICRIKTVLGVYRPIRFPAKDREMIIWCPLDFLRRREPVGFRDIPDFQG